MTTYTYQTTITVKVHMADAGEPDYDDEPAQWDDDSAQQESALEWAEQVMPLHETYAEDFVEIDCPALKLISRVPAPPKPEKEEA